MRERQWNVCWLTHRSSIQLSMVKRIQNHEKYVDALCHGVLSVRKDQPANNKETIGLPTSQHLSDNICFNGFSNNELGNLSLTSSSNSHIKLTPGIISRTPQECSRLSNRFSLGCMGLASCITGDPLHSRAACTQPCNVNTHSRAHCSPGARLCEQWGYGCVNNGARLCASARLCRGSPVCMYKCWSSPMFMFLKWPLVCNFGIVEITFLLTSCLYSCFCTLPKFCLLFFLSNVVFFNSEITVLF